MKGFESGSCRSLDLVGVIVESWPRAWRAISWGLRF